jgi:hypothetical protein
MFSRVKSLWRRDEPTGATAAEPAPETRRNRQKNLKASPACITAFAHIARVSEMSEAALFEDLVAQRWEELRRMGQVD